MSDAYERMVATRRARNSYKTGAQKGLETKRRHGTLYAWNKGSKVSENKLVYWNRLKSKPCLDCGGTFPPCAMEFDHRPDEIKLGKVRQFLGDETKLLAEIAKCDLICANCHAVRTQKRGPSETTRKRISEGLRKPGVQEKLKATRRQRIATMRRKSFAASLYEALGLRTPPGEDR